MPLPRDNSVEEKRFETLLSDETLSLLYKSYLKIEIFMKSYLFTYKPAYEARTFWGFQLTVGRITIR